MTEKEQRRRKRKAHVRRMKAFRIFFWLVVICVLSAGTATILAKYYAKESRKGVATASGLYFSSNYLENTPDGEAYPERLNTSHWDGTGACLINIEIYNYSNILLYNDANLNITYDLHFQMQEAPGENESYQIIYKETDEDGNETEKTINLTGTSEQTISGLYLPGGQANVNSVTLKVIPDTENESTRVENAYRSKKVKVWAVPTAPEYVTNSFNLGAIISASPSKEAFTCTRAFDISETMENKEWAECKNLIDAYSGFVYRVQTNGELDENYDGQSMVLKWNHKYLDLDMYNEYLVKAKEENTYTKDEASGYSTITMELVSYSSLEFDFYKTADFTTENWTQASDFESLVTLEIK